MMSEISSFFPAETVVVSIVPLALYMCVLFFISLWKNDNSIADIGYGVAFIVATFLPYLLRSFLSTQFRFIDLLPLILTAIWGTRLSLRIYLKNKGKPEDFRYASWRASWKWFRLRSFLQVFLLQGCIVYLIALPVVLLSTVPLATVSPITQTFLILGILMWIKGFAFETIGDWQLDQFLGRSESKGRLMTTGLWKFTRHPNYFGESLMWWGIWLISYSVFPEIWFITVLSPLTITFLLLKVSGVPMLEARMSKHPDWPEYARKTNAFIPWFPRR